jgi:hypothetical protein
MFGPSDFDTRHVFVSNYVWDIPYASHASNIFVRTLLGDWQTSGTIQMQSGRPINVSTGSFDQAGVGPGSGNQYYVKTASPALPHQFAGASGTALYFDKSVYVQPAPGTFAGRGTRNSVYGPGFSSYSAAMQKAFHIIPSHENHQLTFRAEAFNYPNHPNWDNPTGDPTSGSFGRVTAKGNTYFSDRQLQFSLRYAF